jgi:hypothetical protein
LTLTDTKADAEAANFADVFLMTANVDLPMIGAAAAKDLSLEIFGLDTDSEDFDFPM